MSKAQFAELHQRHVKLGEGAMTRVYLAWQDDQQQIAYKVYMCKNGAAEESYWHEIMALEHLESRGFLHAVRLLSYCPTKATISMSYCPDPTLARVIIETGVFSPRHAWGLFLALFRVVDQLHGAGVAHHDLKPENIMYNRLTQRVTLVDFGFATLIQHRLERRCQRAMTPFYAPTEAMDYHEEGHILTHVDWYGMAMTVYACIHGDVAFGAAKTRMELRHLRANAPDKMPPITVDLPIGFALLLRQMLHDSVTYRPTVPILRRKVEKLIVDMGDGTSMMTV
jgi:serine/threonine protein kinase